MEKRLISSYDEINDTFVGKVDGENGYCADYGISDGIYLAVNNCNLPASVFVPNASKVFNTSKSVLESSNVRIDIVCNEIFLSFTMSIEDLKIYSTTCRNRFGIPNIKYEIDSNI